MKMNAMQSLYDKHMLYLDVVSGIGGVFFYVLIQNGLRNFKFSMISSVLILAMGGVLLSRVAVDFLYSKFISATFAFGGSNQEFIYSSIAWFLLMGTMFTFPKSVLLYLCTLLVMMATARVTHWG